MSIAYDCSLSPLSFRRSLRPSTSFSFFFNDTATTEIYTLSLHDALPTSPAPRNRRSSSAMRKPSSVSRRIARRDRKSTRLNSSHITISYAVFCLKKKKQFHPANRDRVNLLLTQPSHLRPASTAPRPYHQR